MNSAQLERMLCQSMDATHFLILTIALFSVAVALGCVGSWLWSMSGMIEQIKEHIEDIEQRYWGMIKRSITVENLPSHISGFYDRLRHRDEDRNRLAEFDAKLQAEMGKINAQQSDKSIPD